MGTGPKTTVPVPDKGSVGVGVVVETIVGTKVGV